MGEVDTAIKPASENIDASGLPARRKAERVFGRGKKRPGQLPPPMSFTGQADTVRCLDSPVPTPTSFPPPRLFLILIIK